MVTTEQWVIASKGDHWVRNFLLYSMRNQQDVLHKFSEEKRRAGYGRAAKLIVDGPNGGIFHLWFCEGGIAPKPVGIAIRNPIYMREETLLDCITPNIDLENLVALVEREGGMDKAIYHLQPRLDFRTAMFNELIVIGGDRPDVDSEDWAQLLDSFLYTIAFPLVAHSMLRKGKRDAKRTTKGG